MEKNSLGSLLDTSFRVYKKGFIKFFLVFFLYSILASSFVFITQNKQLNNFQLLQKNIENNYNSIKDNKDIKRKVISPLTNILLSYFLFFLVFKLLFFDAALIFSILLTKDILGLSENPLLYEFKGGLKKLPKFFIFNILSSIVIIAGFICLLIPGFILLLSSFFIYHIILFNGKKPIRTSIGYSYDKAKYVYPGIILLLFFNVVMLLTLNSISMFLFFRPLKVVMNIQNPYIFLQQIINGVSFSIFFPIIVIHSSVLYFSFFYKDKSPLKEVYDKK